jgi:hypothetical protein
MLKDSPDNGLSFFSDQFPQPPIKMTVIPPIAAVITPLEMHSIPVTMPLTDVPWLIGSRIEVCV